MCILYEMLKTEHYTPQMRLYVLHILDSILRSSFDSKCIALLRPFPYFSLKLNLSKLVGGGHKLSI